MLARNPYQCIECGLPLSSPKFLHHAGRREQGPAYWSDQGILCSASCAMQHHGKRRRAGTDMTEPADSPLSPPGFAGTRGEPR